MTVLTTIDADAFRDQGKDGKRKYTGGVIGDRRYPSVTSIKPHKEFKGRTQWGLLASLDVLRAAEWVADNRNDLDEYLGRQALIEAIVQAPTEVLSGSSARGTRIHDALAAHILEKA